MEGSLVPDESKVYLLEYDKFTFAYGEENPDARETPEWLAQADERHGDCGGLRYPQSIH